MKSLILPDTILMKGHAVTLTFNVVTHILLGTRCINMVINYVT